MNSCLQRGEVLQLFKTIAKDLWPPASTTSLSKDQKGAPKGCIVDTRAVFELVLWNAVTDLCPKMLVGDHLGDTFF